MVGRRYRFKFWSWKLVGASFVLWGIRALIMAGMIAWFSGPYSPPHLRPPFDYWLALVVLYWPWPVIFWLAWRWLRVPVQETAVELARPSP